MDDLALLVRINLWLVFDDLIGHTSRDLRLSDLFDVLSGSTHGERSGDGAEHDCHEVSAGVILSWRSLHASVADKATESDCVSIE